MLFNKSSKESLTISTKETTTIQDKKEVTGFAMTEVISINKDQDGLKIDTETSDESSTKNLSSDTKPQLNCA